MPSFRAAILTVSPFLGEPPPRILLPRLEAIALWIHLIKLK